MLSIGVMQAELPTPVVDVPLNEQSADVLPENVVLASGTGAGAGIEKPGAANDAEMGWVRTFAGVKNKIQTATNMSVAGTDARTFSYWAKLDNSSTTEQKILVTGQTQNAVTNFIFIHNVGKKMFAISTNYNLLSDRIEFVNEEHEPLANVWYHCAITIAEGANGSEMTCYINGNKFANGVSVFKDAAKTGDLSLNTKKTKLNIGHSVFGSLSKIKLFDAALTAEQVKELYDSENPSTPTIIEPADSSDAIVIKGQTIVVNGVADIQIYDLLGNVVMERSDVSGQMSVNTLSGIYLLRANVNGTIVTMRAAF